MGSAHQQECPGEGAHCTGDAPPPETDEEMVWCLQAQEEEEEEARRGADAATLAVVREAAGPLTWGQVKGLEAPSLAAGSSQPFAAEAAQLPMAVAT